MSYHPTLGKWTTRDPAGYVDGANLAQYVASSPTSRVDPRGLEGATTQPSTPKMRPGAFPSDLTPIPVPEDDEDGRVEYPTAEGLRKLGVPEKDIAETVEKLKGGCVALEYWLRQKANRGFAPFKCFATPEEANAYQCGEGSIRTTYINQDVVPNDFESKRNEDGTIDVEHQKRANPFPGAFNYGFQQPDGSFIYMNHSQGADQKIIVNRNAPEGWAPEGHKVVTLYCVTCSIVVKDR